MSLFYIMLPLNGVQKLQTPHGCIQVLLFSNSYLQIKATVKVILFLQRVVTSVNNVS